jgi:hypothetical protein
MNLDPDEPDLQQFTFPAIQQYRASITPPLRVAGFGTSSSTFYPWFPGLAAYQTQKQSAFCTALLTA